MSEDQSALQAWWDDQIATQEADRRERRRHRSQLILGSGQTAVGLIWLLIFTFGDHRITFLIWGIGWPLLGVIALVTAVIGHRRTGQVAQEAHGNL